MALGTGGRVFEPTLGPALDTAFSDIIKDLRTQYLLAYYPKDVPLTKNRFHRLQVRARRPDLRVTARNGYYGEAEHQESQLRQDQAENPGIALPNKPLKR
jgi:Ca-activated chloride channel family protein